MRHRRARRELAALLDASLPAPREAAVRAHADGCRRCRRILTELEACESLLAELPASLVPLEPSPQAASRLGALARWAPEPPPSRAERLGIPAMGALAAAAMLAVILTGSPLQSGPQEVARQVAL
ncbi:MAG: zf-HC2 domain-containing protein, partial [Myxococcota bacterium]|nr:zf-HC2 domain-containing protein [Myxococcota bacterium]